jgi:pimeloyl-ACP methyl ester carboxylesterase
MDEQEKIARIQKRRYASVDEAAERLLAAYPRVARDLAFHIARHGLRPNEDGSLGWKYDDTIRGGAPADITRDELYALWAAIPHPTLLVYGAESWASNPATDGRAALFQNARVALIPEAGHNVQHDQPERFEQAVREFLGAA